MSKTLFTVAAALAVAILVAILYGSETLLEHPATPASKSENAASRPPNPHPPAAAPKARKETNKQQTTPKPLSPAKNKTSQPAPPPAQRYCSASHDKADIKALAQAGGLIRIFQAKSELSDTYGCAANYLAHGGEVDAPDPRKGKHHLTALLYAIKHDDSKMVRFLFKHGADPNKAAGERNMKPYGYAVFQALKHRNRNYNKIIEMINSALDRTGSKTAGG